MQKKVQKASVKNDTTSLRDFPTAATRRTHLEEKLGIDLAVFADHDLEANPNVYCENLIGAVPIPVGVAGPLTITGSGISGERCIPLATTEGALVASVSRGCKALSQSGGVEVYAELKGQTRGPVFMTNSVSKGLILKKWIGGNPKKIASVSEATSHHLTYLGAKVKIIGGNTFVRFLFDTSDAMGMNMVTLATEEIVHLVKKETGISCVASAGNFDTDKKGSFLNMIDGRGFEAWAECVIPEKILTKTLHVTADEVYKVWLSKCMIGSYASGSMGFNAHFANIVAAIFIATGQDPAHVVEGSSGIVTCEVREDDLYISVNLPSLLVGTVGGATILPAQKSALSLLGMTKKSKSIELAQIIAGAVLAGELSLLSALSTHTLGTAHKNLGRRKKA